MLYFYVSTYKNVYLPKTVYISRLGIVPCQRCLAAADDVVVTNG